MGTIIRPLCHCGLYDLEMFWIGCGFAGIAVQHEGIPACCDTCHKVVFAKDPDNPECPICGSKVMLYSDPSMRSYDFPEGDPSGPDLEEVWIYFRGKELRLPRAFYKCPKCGEYRMRFSDGGCWD
ncbi:MAG: hypothetical protein ACTSWQ_10120 [Candidatus Thorarchaeota archaeon]